MRGLPPEAVLRRGPPELAALMRPSPARAASMPWRSTDMTCVPLATSTSAVEIMSVSEVGSATLAGLATVTAPAVTVSR
jgi:hypothetical protein